MSIRDWVRAKILEELAFDVDPDGRHGLTVRRGALPTARVYCPEPSENDLFTPDDLEAARQEIPQVQFVVLVRRRAAGDIYITADEVGIGIGGLSRLRNALARHEHIGIYQTAEERFVKNRLDLNRHVNSFRRRGATVYEIMRARNLSTVTIATSQRYELTADETYELLAQNRSVHLDALVTTNPNAVGFSIPTLDASRHAGIRLLTFSEFLNSLGEPWD